MSLNLIITCLVISQAHTEWVEITQHFKKPMKPTHNHPILATVTPIITKNKQNRIYLNQTIEEHSWNDDDYNLHDVNGVKFDDYDVKTGKKKVLNDKRVVQSDLFDTSGNRNKDVLVIQKRKPNGESNSDFENGRRTTVAGNIVRVRPTKATKRKHEGDRIEILNFSDIVYDDEEVKDITKLDKERHNKINRKETVINTTPMAVKRTEKPLKSTSQDDNMNQRPKQSVNNEDGTHGNNRRVQNHDNKPKITGTSHHRQNRPTKPKHNNQDKEDQSTEESVNRLTNLGQVKRVQNEIKGKETVRPNVEINRYSSAELEDAQTLEEIRRIDKTKKPYRSSTERVIPIKNNKPENTRFESFELIDSHNRNPDEIMIEEIIGEVKDIKVHKATSMGTVKRVNPAEVAKIKNRNNVKPLTEAPVVDDEITIEDEDFTHSRDYHKFLSSTEPTPIPTTVKPKGKNHGKTTRPPVNVESDNYERNPYRPRPSHEPMPEFVTKQEDFEEIAEENLEFTTESNVRKVLEHPYINDDEMKPYKEEINPNNNNKNDEGTGSEETMTNETKLNAMEKLIKFLKTVTDIISKNTRRGVQGKMRYLEDLRDTILANIEERIEAAFPADDATGSRRTRSAAEPRGHVEFPSSESALMTISFLTFAVFLIKLVLQIIQAYKNKTMMVVPTMVAAMGRAYKEHQSLQGN